MACHLKAMCDEHLKFKFHSLLGKKFVTLESFINSKACYLINYSNITWLIRANFIHIQSKKKDICAITRKHINK